MSTLGDWRILAIHSIGSSTRDSSRGGTVRLSAFAEIREPIFPGSVLIHLGSLLIRCLRHCYERPLGSEADALRRSGLKAGERRGDRAHDNAIVPGADCRAFCDRRGTLVASAALP